MNFKFGIIEPVNIAAKRVALELIDDSISRLETIHQTFDDSIHETRKNFKKLRSLFKLIRFEIGYDLYKKENILFRDTGKILSGIRDAAVMREALDFVFKQHPGEIDEAAYKMLRRNLSLRARRIRAQFKKNTDLIEAIINILQKHKTEIRKLPLRKKTFDQLVPGIKLVFERGQLALDKSKKYASSENFHEWRKRVKYLWYHTRLLEEAWPEYMNILSTKLSLLSDLLGLEHDLSELRLLLLKEAELCEDKNFQNLVLNFIGQERLKLQSQSKSIAPYIYTESSEIFTSKLEVFWNQSKKNFSQDSISSI